MFTMRFLNTGQEKLKKEKLRGVQESGLTGDWMGLVFHHEDTKTRRVFDMINGIHGMDRFGRVIGNLTIRDFVPKALVSE